MKTKTLFLAIIALLTSINLNAQNVVKGDMNDDSQVTITDVTSLVDVVLGKAPLETITIGGGNPYAVDNSSVVGTWYAPDGTSFSFNEDGTTTFPGGATYEFIPQHGRLLVYDGMNRPIKVLPLLKVESEYLLSVDYATSVFTYYTNSGSLATGITLDQTSLTMNSGTTAQLTATLSPEGAFSSITWTSSNESVATVDANGVITAVTGGTCTITATTSSQKTATCSVTVKQMVTDIVLSQTAVVLELDEFVRLTATVLPENAANKNVVWSSSNENVAPVRGGRVDAYDYGTAVITCEAADGSGVKACCTIYIVDPSTYVDLELPSGTLWATCNIGASCPEDYGDYFTWGETEGYQNGKTYFNWSTYFDTEDNGITFKKYNDNGGLTELELEDDAAYVNRGPAWRMPTKTQFEELINGEYTTTVWTTRNGKNGRLITSKSNSNSIFLPAAGYRYNSSLDYASSIGNYWSRTLCSGRDAWSLRFNSSDIFMNDWYDYYRCSGRSIRPVRLSE